MAAPQNTETTPPQQNGNLAGPVAAVLAAGGATVAGLAPAAAGAVPPAGLALTAAAVAKLTAEILGKTKVFMVGRAAEVAVQLRERLARNYPERTPEVIDDLVREEMKREVTFRRKMLQRLQRDLPKALKEADPDVRREAVLAVLEREQRYMGMREEAMTDRAVANAELISVKELSPKGAYWKLSPLVMKHTPDCIALGEQFWPWQVIDAVGPPPRHHGCRCQLLTVDEAVERDYMDHEHANVNVADSMRRAKKRLKDAGTIQETITPEELAEYLDWLNELQEEAEMSGAMIALYPDRATARKLAVEGGEPVGQLHITLKFLGPDHEELGDALKEKIRVALREFAAGSSPIEGTTNGVDEFKGKPDDDDKPVLAKVKLDGIQQFRKKLVAALPKGVMADTYPEYVPHITLQYVPKSSDIKDFSVPKLPLVFDRVYFVYGGVKEAFKLGTVQEAFDPREPRDELGRWRSLEHVVAAHPDLRLWVNENAAGIKLSMIRTPKEKQGQGLARRAMADLLDYADQTQQKIFLTPGKPEADQSRMTNAKLTAWYKRLGFKPNKGRNKDFLSRETMVRSPGELREAFMPLHDRRGRFAWMGGPKRGKTALIAVDVQHDFLPGGALGVKHGDEVIPALKAAAKDVDLVVATGDQHPAAHMSFVKQGGTWPPHCVAGTHGSHIHPEIKALADIVIDKATQRDVDAYSGFDGTDLAEQLRKEGVTRVVVGGLATDYCVKATALDALAQGFETVVLKAASRGVDVTPGDSAQALTAMRDAGAHIVDSLHETQELVEWDAAQHPHDPLGRWAFTSKQYVGRKIWSGKPGESNLVYSHGGVEVTAQTHEGVQIGQLRMRPGGIIDWLEVDPEWRRKGVATSMLGHLTSLGYKPKHSSQTTGAGAAFVAHTPMPMRSLSESPQFERLHPRSHITGEFIDKAITATLEKGIDVKRAFYPGDASPAHAKTAEYRMRAAAAILDTGTEIRDAVLFVKDEPARRQEILKNIVKGDVPRAFTEYSATPVADLEILSQVVVEKTPVHGQANANLATRRLTMGSTSVTGDFRHELGHALRSAFGGGGGPHAHTPLTTYVAARHDESLARVQASIKKGEPKPVSHEDYETRFGVIGRRALDSWEEDFAEQYRGYHKAVYQATNPDAPDHDAEALERYRTRFPEWTRLWDAWYTAQIAGRSEVERLAAALIEASWHEPRRYARGTREGGQFMPQFGAHPHFLSARKLALLRRLIPEIPVPPAARRDRGRQMTINGRRLFIPEMRAFKRTFGDRTYTSPMGSTELYVNGEHMPGPDYTRAHPLDLGVRSGTETTFVMPPQHPELDERVGNALQAHDAGVPPVQLGAQGWPADETLRERGFMETDFRDTPDGLQFSYLAPDGVSELTVTYSSDGAKVRRVEWTPKEQKRGGRELQRPPQDFAEFAENIDSFARRLAREHGRAPVLGEISVDPEIEGHGGEHEFNGKIRLGRDIPVDVAAVAVRRARGKELTDIQKRRTYASTQSAIHEAVHAAAPCPKNVYGSRGGANMVIDEALTEEIAHLETVEMLRRQGQDDVVQWAADHPTDTARLGTYSAYRKALDDVFDWARVAPELRAREIRRLKLDEPAASWVDELADMAGPELGLTHDQAVQRIVEHLIAVGKPQTSWQASSDWDFVPIAAPNLEPSAISARYEVGGRPLQYGDVVQINTRRRIMDAYQTVAKRGDIVRLSDYGDEGWTADVRLESGLIETGVLPRQIRTVESPELDRVVFGAAASQVNVGTQRIREGDVVRYDGQPDGALSQARVVRIIRSHNPMAPDDEKAWVIEAVTTEDSRAPGTRVLLTDSRVGGLIEPTGLEAELPIGQGSLFDSPAVPLEHKAEVHRHFQTAAHALVQPINKLVIRAHPHADEVEAERRRMSDPVPAPRRAPEVVPRADGRLDVVSGAASVIAAQQMGKKLMPVEIAQARRDLMVADIERHIAAQSAHMAAHGSNAQHEGLIQGLQAGRDMIVRGAEQEDILQAAKDAGPLHGGSTRNQGFQTGMRSAWLTMERHREGPLLHLYGQGPLKEHNDPELARRFELASRLVRQRKGKPSYGWQPEIPKGQGKLPIEPKPEQAVIAEKLRTGDLIRDELDEVWHVQLTGTKQEPTLTLRPEGQKEHPGVVYAEDKLPPHTFVGTVWGGKGGTWSYTPPKPKWDDTHTIELVKPAGGSNGAMIGEKGDEKWLVKTYRGDQDRIATELLANALYRKLGVKVPNAGEISVDGKPALGYPLLDGQIQKWKEPNAELGHGFMTDALLANWDVIGLTQDNVLWDAAGSPFRVDQGGTLQYRAQGGKKPFGPVPTEVWTMAGPRGQAFGTMKLDPADLRAQAAAIAKTLKPGVVDELVQAAPFKDKKMQAEVAEALKGRVAWMRDYAAGKVGPPQPARGVGARRLLKAGQTKLALFPEQDVAVKAWKEGYDAVVNDHLRTGAPKAAAAKEVKFLIRELDGLVRHTRTSGDVEAYAVVPSHLLPAEGAEALTGRTLRDKGYLGLSLDLKGSQAAAEKGVLLRLLVPEGSNALYLNGIPGVADGSRQDVLLGRGSRLRVVRVSVENERTVLDGVLL